MMIYFGIQTYFYYIFLSIFSTDQTWLSLIYFSSQEDERLIRHSRLSIWLIIE
jgi:hypothetical protein